MTIKEIKSIEITLKEGYVIRTDFNGYKDEAGYDLMLSNDNALRVARTLTRLANIFWEHYDKIANERKEEQVWTLVEHANTGRDG